MRIEFELDNWASCVVNTKKLLLLAHLLAHTHALHSAYRRIYYVYSFDFRNLKWWEHKYEFILNVCSLKYHIQCHELKFIFDQNTYEMHRHTLVHPNFEFRLSDSYSGIRSIAEIRISFNRHFYGAGHTRASVLISCDKYYSDEISCQGTNSITWIPWCSNRKLIQLLHVDMPMNQTQCIFFFGSCLASVIRWKSQCEKDCYAIVGVFSTGPWNETSMFRFH